MNQPVDVLSSVGPSMARLDAATSPLTHAIIGAALQVHRELGCGYLEAAYQEAFAYELQCRQIAFEREAPVEIHYRGIVLDCKYRADFLVQGAVIVEFKAVQSLAEIHEAQVLNYLKGTGLRIGLLLNFGEQSLAIRRFVNGEAPVVSAGSVESGV